MKQLCFLALLMIGMLSAQTANAQATNNTNETWVINYYGATTIVAPGATIAVNQGSNCTAGISVRNFTSCGNIFTAPATWTAGCSVQTNTVTFNATAGNPAIFCTPFITVYSNPVFTFQ